MEPAGGAAGTEVFRRRVPLAQWVGDPSAPMAETFRLADEVLSLVGGQSDGDGATTRAGGPSTDGLPRRDSQV